MTTDTRAVLTPSQLNTLARSLLEDAFPLVLVEGELANVSRPASGHVYFTLKDARAQVRCALFKPKSQWLAFAPKDGMRVLARGRLTLYEARGDYQLILDSLEDAGEGALRREFDALRARLLAEGLFDDARKRPLPAFVRRLALITSPGGAVVRDVLSVLARRFPLLEVDVLPVTVQGSSAAPQVTVMLDAAARSGRYDAVLLARGGGSMEDLWAFNDEALVRAIVASPVPVVSAIGHETDFTLADFAADVRAPTPSVAAELLVPDRSDLGTRLAGLQRRQHALHLHRMRESMQRADRAALRLHAQRPQARLLALSLRQAQALRRLQAAWQSQAARREAQLRRLDTALRGQHPQRRVATLRARLAALWPRPQRAVERRLHAASLRTVAMARALEAISPLATVARGYAIVQHDDGRVVRNVGDAAPGDRLRARLHDGTLSLRVLDDAGHDPTAAGSTRP